jgi:hypothetical protein
MSPVQGLGVYLDHLGNNPCASAVDSVIYLLAFPTPRLWTSYAYSPIIIVMNFSDSYLCDLLQPLKTEEGKGAHSVNRMMAMRLSR